MIECFRDWERTEEKQDRDKADMGDGRSLSLVADLDRDWNGRQPLLSACRTRSLCQATRGDLRAGGERDAPGRQGVRGNVSRGLLNRAAGQFARAADIFGGTVKRISVVPRPSADMATLARWFTDLHLQESYLNKIAGALRAGEKVRAQGYEARFVHYGNAGNNVVLSFEFHACRFDPTRFG